MNTPRTVVVGFDNVFRKVPTPFGASDAILEAIPWVSRLLDGGWNVAVFDHHSATRKGREMMKHYIGGLVDLAVRINLNARRILEVRKLLSYPKTMPRYHLMYYPRAWEFVGRYPSVQEVRDYLPWSGAEYKELMALMRRFEKEKMT